MNNLNQKYIVIIRFTFNETKLEYNYWTACDVQ